LKRKHEEYDSPRRPSALLAEALALALVDAHEMEAAE
jgi:hypothetical protein